MSNSILSSMLLFQLVSVLEMKSVPELAVFL
jgi:hypothetical protein